MVLQSNLQLLTGSLSAGAVTAIAGVVFVLGLLLLTRSRADRPAPNIPIFSTDRDEYFRRGYELVREGQKRFPGCFQLRMWTGWKIVLPNRYADEIRNNHYLSFAQAHSKEAFTDYAGFEAMEAAIHDDYFMQEVVRVKLTQSLAQIFPGVVQETKAAMGDVLGASTTWKTHNLKDVLPLIIARITTHVFLGKELCRNPEWLDLVINHTMETFVAQKRMRSIHPLLRPLVHWFLPEMRRLRMLIRKARNLILPEVKRREALAKEALKKGRIPKHYADAISWMVEVAKRQNREVDVSTHQVSLSMTAIQTTSEVVSNHILQLCETPEVVPQLRAEIIPLLRDGGWSKNALYNMKLLDSFMVESLRKHHFFRATMFRGCTEDVVLSDGTVLPKGSSIMVDDDGVMDPTINPEPEKFDAARYLKKRQQPGHEERHQFVTLQTDMMPFGYGMHACPGRFFANAEIKTMLCYLLLKYDVRFEPGQTQRLPDIEYEVQRMVNPKNKVQIKLRDVEPEVDLSAPEVDYDNVGQKTYG